jgi:hypothetical protein
MKKKSGANKSPLKFMIFGRVAGASWCVIIFNGNVREGGLISTLLQRANKSLFQTINFSTETLTLLIFCFNLISKKVFND